MIFDGLTLNDWLTTFGTGIVICLVFGVIVRLINGSR